MKRPAWLGGRPARPPHFWQYEPYAFEPGQKVVIEINTQRLNQATGVEDIQALKQWFRSNGINAHLVLTYGEALKPVALKRYAQEPKQ